MDTLKNTKQQLGCATTAIFMYGMAEAMDVPILGCPGAGVGPMSLNGTRSQYPLMFRVPWGVNGVSRFFVRFMRNFGYFHLSVFRDDSFSFFAFLSWYMMDHFQHNYDLLFRHASEMHFNTLDLKEDKITEMLETAKNQSRGMINCFYHV